MKGIIRRTNLREIATNKKSNRMKGKRKNKNNMCSCLEKKIEKCDTPNSLGMLSIEEPVTILGHIYFLGKGFRI